MKKELLVICAWMAIWWCIGHGEYVGAFATVVVSIEIAHYLGTKK